MNSENESAQLDLGSKMHQFARDLWDLPRSITGDGVRDTLRLIQERLPELSLNEVPSGTEVGDWVVPPEWNLRRARLLDDNGTVICDTRDSNLHIVGYSIPFHGEVDLDELQAHLFSIPEQPDAIPYVTSYYERRWGFCLPHRIRETLRPGKYLVDIDTTLGDGSLTYAEYILPGAVEREIFISTYVCHPAMANNEISGPVVATELADYLSRLSQRRYTYRFVFAPETIGAITYIHQHGTQWCSNVSAAFNLTCLGDDRSYSLLPTKRGNQHVDRVARHVLNHLAPSFREYPWSSRGSDERQYAAPLVDLPMISIMRSKYWEYPEYHTSLDDLQNVVTPAGLHGGFEALRRAIEILENDVRPRTLVIGEPMLGKRGLYSSLGAGRTSIGTHVLLDVWSYCDGSVSSLEIAEKLQIPFSLVQHALSILLDNELITVSPEIVLR